MKVSLNPDALTFGDLEDFETTTGSELLATLSKIDVESGDMSGIKAKDLVVLLWICQRATDPNFTLEDARKVRLSEIEFEEVAPDPTSGAAAPS